jgi:photosystem II stability/assembly factor-like uncharacterized protein
MVVQAPPPRPKPEAGIDAGVLKDARARQRRQASFATVLIAVAAIAVLLGFGAAGGGGAGAPKAGRGNGSNPTGAHTASSQVGSASPYSPPTIGASGLLSPGVGWAVNGLGFYMTWNGGRRWFDVHVPKLSGDVLAGFMTASSPNARTLVLAIGDGGSSYGTCSDPAGTARRAIGDIAVSTDAGRNWRTSPFPDCSVPTQISFTNARVGFAVGESGKAVSPELLYGTLDGGHNWHRIGALPKPGPIDFTTRQTGWLHGGNTIYRTADGGKTWQRTNACSQPADRTVTRVCGTPHFFGTQGVVQTVRAVGGVGDSAFVSTTRDDGSSWTAHNIAVPQRTQSPPPAQMSAVSPENLFVYFQGGLMARSADGGRSWQTLPAPQFKGGAAINFTNARYGWIQDGGSIYATSDGGEHWHRMKQAGNRPPSP